MTTPRVIAVGNQKGGVGKTTVAVGLAERLAVAGRRVLLVDADQQGNATARLGVEVTETTLTMADVLAVDPKTGKVLRGGLVDAALPAGGEWAGLIDVVPADFQLGARENDQYIGREMRLRTAMAGEELGQRYDDVVIDCPPDLGQLTVNALIAAHRVVCVTEARADSVDGVQRMVSVVEQIAEHYNPGLNTAGILVNKFRRDRIDQQAWTGKLVDLYGDALIEPFLPERELLAKAATEAVPLAMLRAAAGVRAEVEESLDAVVARLAAGA
jgi:chromosome partitioning protein